MDGIFFARDARAHLTQPERIPPLVQCLRHDDPIRGSLQKLTFPPGGFGVTFATPDEDSSEALVESRDGDHARWVTSAGEVVFRKVLLADRTDLELIYPDVEFPDWDSQEEMEGWLEENFFLPFS